MKVEILFFNAGGGHRSAAEALQQVLEQQYQYEVKLTNLFDIIDPAHFFQKITGFDHEDLYNKVLASGFTIGLGTLLKVLQGIIRIQHKSLVKKLRAHWKISQPDFVISVIPNFNRAIGESINGEFMTVITDLADNPPNFWIEPGLTNQHVVCGTKYAVQQALNAGVSSTHVHRAQGMIIKPAFYEVTHNVTNSEPVGIVMFGGAGSNNMILIAKKLKDRRLILVCGKNNKLKEKLLKLQNPKHVIIGFSNDIPGLMKSADYFIGKPGPGSISEAMFMQLPVIVLGNAFTIPQERWNVQLVQSKALGFVVPNFKKIDSVVQEMLAELEQFKANTQVVHVNAIFDIPKLITKISSS